MLRGLIFDLDGTLVDTNAMHVEAWWRTFREFGYEVARERIFPEVGKGADKLIPSIHGEEVDARLGDEMRKRVTERWIQLASGRRFRVLPGAVELIERARRHGLRTALATSSYAEQLDATLESAGVDFRHLVDAVVTGSDALNTKPDPDLVVASVRRLRLPPEQCAMVGDTPHDGEACNGAGVRFLGLTCGGHDDESLRAAGAWNVWGDPASLAAELERVVAGDG